MSKWPMTSVVGMMIWASVAAAQSPTLAEDVRYNKGFHTERNYFSPEPWESFDVLSGNVILAFTDLVLPGNAGRALRFQRVYNNQKPEVVFPEM